MRRALTALLLCVAVGPAAAEENPCWPRHDGEPFAACFDPGNRLALGAAFVWDGAPRPGYALEIDLRGRIGTTDPGVTWRFEHRLLALETDGEDLVAGVIYAGEGIRHSRDGHLLIPTARPKRVWIPFDIGARWAVGEATLRRGETLVDLTVVRAAPVFDFARSEDTRLRLSVEPVAGWTATLDTESRDIVESTVTPMTVLAAAARGESRDGILRGSLLLEGGAEWRTSGGFHTVARGRAEGERVLIALNDWPLSIYVAGRADLVSRELRAEVGLRFWVFPGRRK